MINFVRVTVRVNDGEDFNSHALGFSNTDVFTANINHEDGLGNFCHVAHAGEILFQPGQLVSEFDSLFLGKKSEISLIPLLLEFQHVGDAGTNGLEVCHGAAQPALVDVQHAAAFSLALDHFLGLALGTHEQNLAALGYQINHLLIDIVNHAQGLLQVNDVDTVSLGEDVLLHGGVPASGLMPEVDARLK